MSILVNIVGLAMMAWVIWWFWLYKNHHNETLINGLLDIEVDDGRYQPSHIKAKVNQEITLRITRKTANPCAGTLIIDAFNINAELPLGQAYDITFTPDKVGEFSFCCQMAMYRGKLSVIE